MKKKYELENLDKSWDSLLELIADVLSEGEEDNTEKSNEIELRDQRLCRLIYEMSELTYRIAKLSNFLHIYSNPLDSDPEVYSERYGDVDLSRADIELYEAQLNHMIAYRDILITRIDGGLY